VGLLGGYEITSLYPLDLLGDRSRLYAQVGGLATLTPFFPRIAGASKKLPKRRALSGSDTADEALDRGWVESEDRSDAIGVVAQAMQPADLGRTLSMYPAARFRLVRRPGRARFNRPTAGDDPRHGFAIPVHFESDLGLALSRGMHVDDLGAFRVAYPSRRGTHNECGNMFLWNTHHDSDVRGRDRASDQPSNPT
jgi:hypothetical protein